MAQDLYDDIAEDNEPADRQDLRKANACHAGEPTPSLKPGQIDSTGARDTDPRCPRDRIEAERGAWACHDNPP